MTASILQILFAPFVYYSYRILSPYIFVKLSYLVVYCVQFPHLSIWLRMDLVHMYSLEISI